MALGSFFTPLCFCVHPRIKLTRFPASLPRRQADRHSCPSNERLFLRDFVLAAAGTSGGRLAHWLQPDPYVDVSRCELVPLRNGPPSGPHPATAPTLRCDCPATFTLHIRDQYGNPVQVPNLKVEMKAIPIEKKVSERKAQRLSQCDQMTFGGHPQPPLDVPYQVTIKDRMNFYSISIMKAYENYSFEELRFMAPPVQRTCETMMVRAHGDGSVTGTWTPANIGCYSIQVTIDDCPFPETMKVEVKEPPQGVNSAQQIVARKVSHQPNKIREFVGKNSAGLRIRAHPSLQSEQIGIVPCGATVAFVDEVRNSDGIWVRLCQDTIRQYCQGIVDEAWCLQLNQHFGKTLLVPLSTNPPVPQKPVQPELSDRNMPAVYKVVMSGASGHNVRDSPSLKGTPVGMLVLGDSVTVIDHVINNEGKWVRLSEETIMKKCLNQTAEAWSLALDKTQVAYLRPGNHESPRKLSTKTFLSAEKEFSSSPKKSQFDFGNKGGKTVDVVDPKDASSKLTSTHHNLFIFGSSAQTEVPRKSSSKMVAEKECSTPSKKGSSFQNKVSALVNENVPSPINRILHRNTSLDSAVASGNMKSAKNKDVTPRTWSSSKGSKIDDVKVKAEKHYHIKHDFGEELQNVSVKDLVSRANGNRTVIPAQTTTPRKVPHSSNAPPSPGSSPSLPASSWTPSKGTRESVDSASSSPLHSSGISPLVSMIESGGGLSNTSAMISSITPDPSSAEAVSDKFPDEVMKIEILEFNSNNYNKSLMQTGTQTSPDKNFQNCFNFGTVPEKEEPPRRTRKERIHSHKRSASPPQRQAVPPTPVNAPTHSSKTKESSASVKEALSPSVAESIRAVFAALLWHEGIVHDAMACASFLKFYPTLSKQGVTVTPRHIKREKIASHRHSVEVSMAESFLHIAPSTLETLTLTRQAATVSANRQHRAKHKQQQSIIKEEVTGDKRPSTQSQLQMLGERIEKGKQDEGKVPQPSMLPPALKCLVLLWEQLTSNCLQIFESSAVSSQTFSSMNKLLSEETEVRRSVRKKKELKANTANAENSKNVGNKCSEKEAVCELCGNFYPHPVTYHMRQAHPGCGGHAGGNGYNSGGNYCVGWAGNCGDGGLAGSSWYIICNSCREKYLEIMKRATAKKSTRKKSAKLVSPSPTASATSLFHGSETHLTMRDNAMFLLELSGGSKNTMNLNQSPPDFINSEFPPPGPFQCLQSLGANPEVLRDDSPPLELMPKRRDSDIFSSSRPLSVCESESRGLFHRSISMGMNGVPWPDSKILNSKKRNSAICDPNSDSSSSLLGHPSAALRKLVPSVLGDLSSVEIKGSSQGIKSTFDIMSHPVLAFICQKHNLVSLRLAMKQSLRKATCRVYAMQALNWLLHSATQAICLHDLLWWFVAALTPIQTSLLTTTSVNKEESSEFCKLDRKDSEEMGWVCEHPLSDMGLVGEAVYHLPSTFHILLQTIADLMLLLPMGSALQQMAVRCWGIRFTQTDHMFLHRSKVFSNISKILARSEEIEDPSHSFHESHVSTYSQTGTYVEILGDLTSFVDIKASSRQAMIGSLTDNSTETFWESGDEDRSKTKSLMFVSPANLSPRMIYVHIDNCRDIANKVSSIVFLAGANGDELFRLRSIDVEVRASGWINCPILNNNHSVVKLELKGPDSSLRVRQVRILGEIEGESLRLPQQHSAMTIQQRNTEAETLRVFRLITAQVFGKLLEGKKEINSCDEGSEETNDLKEHMVGILFSRSKLTHLQKQVCMHIVQAIRRESVGIREDWEHRLCSGSGTSTTELSDSYCFEMLSMVLALSGSSVGRSYLAHQHAFLLDLTGLLHTGSARIQRQVILLLRRMLPEVSPSTLADILRVESLPPTDISVALATYRSQEMEFNPHRAGLLDVLFSCIAKALTVQIKVKGSKDSKGISSVSLATSIHPRDEVGCRWWLRGSILRKLAEDIINLIKDMCLGRLSEIWVKVTKAAIAECILNLTRLTESDRESVNCLRSPTLWLALAALCVLHPDHVDSLSSAQWDTTPDGKPPPPRPTCTNHDDGETSAIIQCNACGNLCADCDRFLHLHRRTRMHQRQVCKEEEEAIKVDLHEGCGRIKLFWILALADSCTLKAMVEFRERTRLQSKLPGLTLGVCRFCGTTGNSGLLAIGNICADQDCQEHAKNACSKVHPCGHMCAGIVGEIDCLPCLHGCGQDNSLKQDADDMCMICFTEALSCAPSIQLRCGHIFHLHCCRSQLLKKWAGPRITFSFQQCPICKAPIEHPVLNDLLIPIRNLLEDVGRKALMRLEYEGLDRGRPDPASYAIERYAYYVCFKCNKAYYGGEARCDAELGRGDFDPSELVCGGCSDVSRAQMCPKHGTDFLEYKCRYCCSVAVFFCFGTTHFCNACHDDFQRVTNIPPSELPTCPAGPKARQLDGEDCPLHIRHPPTGVEFALGCGVCRNAHTF
nr:PREDICTED: E3 ubiquitin-protein ligase MYCBP2-like [Bemisia tabaci]